MKSKVVDASLEPVMEFSESFIDNLSKNEIVKQVPFLKSAVAVVKVGSVVHDWLFVRKVWGFVKDERFSAAELNQVVREIDASKKYRIKAGEAILNRIDKAQDWEIAEILGKLVKARIEKKLSIAWFMRISDQISGANMTDIQNLLDVYNSDYKGRAEIHESKINSAKMNLGSGFYYLNNKPLSWDGDTGISIFMKREMQVLCRIICGEDLDGTEWREFR